MPLSYTDFVSNTKALLKATSSPDAVAVINATTGALVVSDQLLFAVDLEPDGQAIAIDASFQLLDDLGWERVSPDDAEAWLRNPRVIQMPDIAINAMIDSEVSRAILDDSRTPAPISYDAFMREALRLLEGHPADDLLVLDDSYIMRAPSGLVGVVHEPRLDEPPGFYELSPHRISDATGRSRWRARLNAPTFERIPGIADKWSEDIVARFEHGQAARQAVDRQARHAALVATPAVTDTEHDALKRVAVLAEQHAKLLASLDSMVNWVIFHTVDDTQKKHWNEIGKAEALLRECGITQGGPAPEPRQPINFEGLTADIATVRSLADRLRAPQGPEIRIIRTTDASPAP